MRPYPNVFIGDKFTNRLGSECEVIEYINNERVKIKFLDDGGHEKYVTVQSLRKGNYSNPNKHSGKGKKISIFVGQTFETNTGGLCKVIEYINSKKILVEFCDNWKYRVYCGSQQLRKGQVKNVYTPVVAGVGFVGEGVYKTSEGGKPTPAYRAWADMFSRSYRGFSGAYIGVTVQEDWHNFQVFADWYYKQKGCDKNFELDKDLIVKGNRVYSADTCCLVPREINLSILNSRVCRGKLPLGVTKSSKGSRYIARLHRHGESFHLGCFKSVEDAFLTFKIHKEAYLKSLAEKWKEVIDYKVYAALNNYKIEIND